MNDALEESDAAGGVEITVIGCGKILIEVVHGQQKMGVTISQAQGLAAMEQLREALFYPPGQSADPKPVASKSDSATLFGSSSWRAEAWKDIQASAQTGDRIEGEGDFSGGKLCVTVRVQSKPFRKVYVREAGANHEYPLEYFATIARTMTRLPND